MSPIPGEPLKPKGPELTTSDGRKFKLKLPGPAPQPEPETGGEPEGHDPQGGEARRPVEPDDAGS